MTPVDKFLPFVLPYADSVPLPVARVAIAKAANQFCAQSLLWQEEYPEVKVHPGKFVSIPVPKSAMVVKVMSVAYNGFRLTSTSRDELNSTNVIDYRLFDGPPKFFFQADLNELRLVPEPVKHGVLSIVVALAPTPESTEVPTSLYTRFWEAIANGALADIKQVQGQSYSDPNAALAYKALFQQGVREAKNEAVRSMGRTVGRVAYQRVV